MTSSRTSEGNFDINLTDLSFSDSFSLPPDDQEKASGSNFSGADLRGPGSLRYLTDLSDEVLNPVLKLQKNLTVFEAMSAPRQNR